MSGLLPEVRKKLHYLIGGSLKQAAMARFRTIFIFAPASKFVSIACISLLLLCAAGASGQSFLMSNSRVSTCSGNFYDSGGGNSQYGNDEDYVMTFCSDSTGMCIQVNFTQFALENGNDTLLVYNGSNTSASLIGTFTGNTIPSALTGTNGCLTFRFTSNPSTRRNGWAATISCIRCVAGPCREPCTGVAPGNDDCSGAQNLDTLPRPGPCLSNGTGGVGAWTVLNSTNLCATPEFPYSAMRGCQPTNSDTMANPASDVWFRFTITAPTLNIRITGMQEPNVGLYKGNNCNSLTGLGCAVGSNGFLNTTFGGLPVGTYYLQVSGGSMIDQCSFLLEIQNNYDCQGCVIQSGIVATPPPINGTYLAGQRVNFCYTITDYNQTSNNWLHGVVPSFGPGWDLSTLTTTPSVECPVVPAPGTWSWYNTVITSSVTTLSAGPGFFFETSSGGPGVDGNPGNNYGDYNPNNACDWTFCWSVTTLPPAQCVQGASLNIDVDTYGDGETGSWGSLACTQDAITHFFATLACCNPPQLTIPPIACFGGVTTVTATGQGIGPWSYTWKNSAGTVLQSTANVNGSNTISNLAAGTYSIIVVDNSGCTVQELFSVSAPAALIVNVVPTSVSCFGNSNGSIAGSVLGGTPGYSYAWTPSGGNTANATGLSIGNYTLTVTDASGCTASAFAIVAEPTQVNANITSNVPVSCNGLNNGSATVTAGGGIPGYSYAWSPAGGNSATATNLAAGNYSVTVTDSKGCSQATNVLVNQPAALDIHIDAFTPVSCNGGNNGSASSTATGGTQSYTYAWSPSGGNAATANNLASGNYTVTVTDANGCTASSAANIAQPPVLTANITASQDVSCFGGKNAFAAVTAGGGTPGYTYLWAPSGGNAATASNLTAGNYSVTVTDNMGCISVANVTLNQPAPLVVNVTSVTPVSCFGSNNGSATVSASGGIPGYNYSWSPSGGNAASATNLTASSYTVIVTDANGCQGNVVAPVIEPALPLTYNSTILASPTCGTSNGSASVTPVGGTAPYIYQWLPTGGTGPVAANLAAGAYTVNITDANGCTAQASVGLTSITGPSLAVISTSDASCFGSANGSASVQANNGTPGYSFAWLPAGGNASSATNLSAGNYTVTVIDAIGCQATVQVTIGQPLLLSSVISGQTPVSCEGGSNGTAEVTANGGAPGYTYSWSPSGGNAATAINLPAGNYTVTVTDNNGCTQIANAQVAQPPALLATLLSSTPVSCFGGNDGTATASASGGTAGYTFTWSPSGGNAATAVNLPSGNFIVTVTDANGCTANANANIVQPVTLISSISNHTDASCFGNSNGEATVNVQGGSPGYQYAWAPTGGSGVTASGLLAGNYSVTVTDSKGCTDISNVVIGQPPSLQAQVSSFTHIRCFGGSDGTATASANGGAPGYSFAWNPSGTTGASATNLGTGNYTVTVTDANGCTAAAGVSIAQPPALFANITSTQDAGCNGGNNGSASVTAGGGTPGYIYAWSPAVAGGNTLTATNLSAGNYSVTVTDTKGCMQVAQAVIGQPALLDVTVTQVSNVNCFGGTNGSATAAATGGTAGYSYSWSPSGGNNSTASGLSQGNYSVTVTDAHGCTSTAAAVINQPAQLAVGITGQNDALCYGGNTGSASVGASGGSPSYSFAWAPSGGTASSASGLASGNYVVTVTDVNGCNVNTNIVIGQPPALNASIVSPVPVSCYGGNNGSATVSVSGGTPGYLYAWLPSGGNASSASNLTSGNFAVTVTDANGCMATSQVNITQPTLLQATVASFTDVNCYGGNDGTSTASASGGTAPYQYAWSPSGGNNFTATGLTSGTYSVDITDNNGCNASAQVVIDQPLQLTAALSTSDALCGFANGTASVVPSGGVGSYTYSWSPSGGPGAWSDSLAAGNYTITVSDVHLCTWTGVASVSSIGGPVASAQVLSHVGCNNASNGSATVNIQNGTGPFSFAWTPSGGNAQTASNLSAGNYSVTITDSHGCLSTDNVLIQQPAVLQAQVQPFATSCFGMSNGSAQAVVNGGTAPYVYSWSQGGSGSSVAGLAAGNHHVDITDAHGCTAGAAFQITQPSQLNVIANPTPASCFGGSNGTALAQPSGGTPGYSYQWFPSGISTSTATGLAAGNYTVTVTDAKGCTAQAVTQVIQPGVINPVIIASAGVSCAGGSDGTATVSVTGGSAAYQYQWLPSGGNSAVATQLIAGNYTVHITDAQGCTGDATVVIGQPFPLVSAISTHTDAGCFGASDGAATVSVQGGSPGYLYAWSPSGGTGSSAVGLASGNYSVTVTDSKGCTSASAVLISQPSALAAQASQQHAVGCYNGNDGSAGVNVSGGSQPYNYAWSPSGGTAATAGNLSAQNYTVTVTDDHGCSTSTAVLIAQPSPINLAVGSQPATCNATNGSANVAVLGGTVPYSILWSTGGTGTAITSVGAGNYTVTVTDAHGCSVSDIANVQNINGPIATAQAVNHVSCFGGNNGSVSVSINSGTPPFQYLWSSGAGTGITANNLSVGTYSVTVTDALGCISVDQVIVTEPEELQSSVQVTDARCFGSTDGLVNASATGGTLPYAYAWLPGGSTQAIVNGLAAGNYAVTISDAHGCVSNTTFQVQQPLPVGLTVHATPVDCNGSSTGTASARANGGTAPYAYAWSNGDTASLLASVAAGRYLVSVNDAHSCPANDSVEVTQPPHLVAQPSATPSTCGFPNGSAQVLATGGMGNFSYAWTPGNATSSTLQNIAGGNYTVTVTDENGCISQVVTMVPSIPGPTVAASMSRRVSCFNGSDGSVTSLVNSGTAPFNYQWSGGAGTGPVATGLPAGVYALTITDSNGCVSSDTAMVRQPAAIGLFTQTAPAACNSATGSASVQALGGTGAYTYAWTFSSSTTSSATSLVPGLYSVTVTDVNGCNASASMTVQNINGPVPTVQSATPVSCFGGSNGSASVTLSGGTPPFSYSWSPAGGSAQTASGLAAGVYAVIITDGLGCQGVTAVTIDQPQDLVLAMASTPSSCGGLPDGTASVTVTGGTTPYQYLWSNGGAGNSLSNLLPGNYNVLVTDNHACSQSAPIIVSTPTHFTSAIASTDVVCYGQANGTAEVSASGGTPPFNYLWSPGGATSSSLTNLAPGIYTANITDAAGCRSVMSDTVSQPQQLVLNATGSTTLCYGQSATLTASVTGGTQPYQFSWSNGFTGASQTVSPLALTNYSVHITDANGCITAPMSLPVAVHPPLSVSASATDSICEGASASIASVASGGNGGPYTYSWNGGALTGSTAQVLPLHDTLFTVSVNDGCSAPAQAAVSVRVNPLPQPQFLPHLFSGCAPLTVAFNDSSQSTAGSIYQWALGDGTASNAHSLVHVYQNPGQYTVSLSIRSLQGCSAQLSVPNAVKVFAVPKANFTMSDNQVTFMNPLVEFTDLSTNATNWYWDFGDLTGTSRERNPSYAYQDTGVYVVMLITRNAGGCADTVYRILSVDEDFNVYIPNAFTPNFDGQNDGFIAKGTGITGFEMLIYDRWGMMLYQTTSMDAPWNGTMDNTGQPCIQDVYVYKMRVFDNKNRPHDFIGKVTLVR